MLNYRLDEDIEIVKEIMELTDQELADALDISRITLGRWRNAPDKITPLNLANFYNFAFKNNIRLNKIKEQFYIEDYTKNNQVVLFHGSKNSLEEPLSLKKSKKNNDFGIGFYCGEKLEQAAMFVANYPNSSLYALSLTNKDLTFKQYHVDQEWMLTIAYFRGRLGTFANSAHITELLDKLQGIDYIIAPIADNRMFQLIDSFVDGEMTDLQCQHALSATNLGKQYVFLTDEALCQIKLLERCYLAPEEKTYYLQERMSSLEINHSKVKLARKQYRNQGKYIEEILS